MRASALIVPFTVIALASDLPGADDLPIHKLRVVLAIDTESDLRESVEIDQQRMTRLLKGNIPADKLEIQTIIGTQLTAANVVKHYKGVKAGPDDALLFYYAGHGAKDPTKGNAFMPQQGKAKPIFRTDVRDAMKQTGAGLVVLLTDCCSTKMKLLDWGGTRAVYGNGAAAAAIHPTLEALFFRHKGVVDITAASDGQASWSDLSEGGVFTRTLAKQIVRPPVSMDADRDGMLTWKEFYPVLHKESDGAFIAWSAQMRRLGEAVEQKTQVPVSFSLGQVVKPSDVVAKPNATSTDAGTAPAKTEKPASKSHAVICLVNESGEDLKYQFRWSDKDEWQMTTLAPSKRNEHTTPIGPTGIQPFRVMFGGSKTVIDLEADTWTGDKPPPGAGSREYPIILRK